MGSRHSVAFSSTTRQPPTSRSSRVCPMGTCLYVSAREPVARRRRAEAELDSQRLFVRELEESGTQLAMDLKRSVHDHSSEIVEFLVRFGMFGALGVLAVHVQLSTARTLGCANPI